MATKSHDDLQERLNTHFAYNYTGIPSPDFFQSTFAQLFNLVTRRKAAEEVMKPYFLDDYAAAYSVPDLEIIDHEDCIDTDMNCTDPQNL